MLNRPSFFPQRTSAYVPDMHYSSDVGDDGIGTFLIDAVAATSPNGILDAHDVASGTEVSEFGDKAKTDVEGTYGRNVVAASTAGNTTQITIVGRDYLGQGMREQLTLNGATAVVGKKAFYFIEKVIYAVSGGATLSLGWGNAFGLPYKATKLLARFVNDIEAAQDGAFVAGENDAIAQTAITGDTRGTWTPAAAAVPDGTRSYKLTIFCDKDNLHGARQFAG